MKPSSSASSSNEKAMAVPAGLDSRTMNQKIDAMDWADTDIDDIIAGFVASNGEASRRGSTASSGTEPVNRKASLNNSK